MSWVEFERDVPVRYEVDELNDRITLYFGQDDDYVLVLGRENLGQLLDLGTEAKSKLDAAIADQR